jgi:hypothetical protein
MKVRNEPDPYQFDAAGKLAVPEGTTEEQQVILEAAVLNKEGLSDNSVADVAEQYAEEKPAPVIDSLDPASATIGSDAADFTLKITGSNFDESSIIYFANHDEPTTLNEDGTLSTGVKPSLWQSPATVQCQVKNGNVLSNAVDFEFEAAEEGGTQSSRRGNDDDHSERGRRGFTPSPKRGR